MPALVFCAAIGMAGIDMGGKMVGSAFATELRAAPRTQDSAAQDLSQLTPRQLVELLGAPRFRQREHATKALAALGLTAQAELTAGLDSGDAEIRSRCQILLNHAQAQDRAARLSQFLADLDGTKGYGLPGYERYAETIGSTREARQLYAMMLENSPELMSSLNRPANETTQLLAAQVDAVFSSVYGSQILESSGAAAALYYASSIDGVKCGDETLEMLGFLAGTGTFGSLAETGELSEPSRKVLDGWIRHNGEQAASADMVVLALRLRLPSGLNVALKKLNDENSQPRERMYCILAVAQLGDVSHRKDLVKFFTDQAICQEYVVPGNHWQAQVRDIALAGAIHLSGENPREFGFVNCERSETQLFNPSTLAFSSDTDRQKAFAMYLAKFGPTATDGN